MARPYRSKVRERIQARAMEMVMDGERINKSRIARELHVPLRTVFRALPRVTA